MFIVLIARVAIVKIKNARAGFIIIHSFLRRYRRKIAFMEVT